ncbi:MAG: aspartate/glutamate racemase family protein [Ewingella sp.]
MHIACLHTADSNIAIFNAMADQLGLTPDRLSHHSRPDLLLAAAHAGGLTADIEQQTVAVLLGLAQTADLVLLTCSTLGPAAAVASAQASVPVWRVDQALATQAMSRAGKTQVLYAVNTTLEPTQKLFEQVSHHPQAQVEFSLVEGAWEKFIAGDIAGYLQNVAAAADRAFQQGVDRVALAQASMSGAAELTQFGVPLTSPRCGLRVAIEHLRKRQFEEG